MIIILLLFLLAGVGLWVLPRVPPKMNEFGRLFVLATLIALIPVLAGEVRVR